MITLTDKYKATTYRIHDIGLFIETVACEGNKMIRMVKWRYHKGAIPLHPPK